MAEQPEHSQVSDGGVAVPPAAGPLSPAIAKSVMIPESLRKMQSKLLRQEAALDQARRIRNIEVARLRDVENISQYRIAKWLDVTERAVMLMAKQGRESQSDPEVTT